MRDSNYDMATLYKLCINIQIVLVTCFALVSGFL